MNHSKAKILSEFRKFLVENGVLDEYKRCVEYNNAATFLSWHGLEGPKPSKLFDTFSWSMSPERFSTLHIQWESSTLVKGTHRMRISLDELRSIFNLIDISKAGL